MLRGALVAALAALTFAGCGGGDDEVESGPGLPTAGGGGSLAYAVPELPATLDPLTASGRSAQLVTRQMHEPLIASLSRPYDHGGEEPGLALSAKPSPDRTVWRLPLRSGVRFQDGTPFNAQAVLANGRRWGSSPQGRSLLPGLFAVDAPRPDEVRFQFSRPRPDLPELLSSPRLGIVSPQALAPKSGAEARYRRRAAGSGTGPFRLETKSSGVIAISRDPSWWGTPLGLGPALDAVSFPAFSAERDRLEALVAGEVEAAEALGEDGLAVVERDPLLRAGGTGDDASGYEASVRGLDQASAVPVLSAVWLTTIAD